MPTPIKTTNPKRICVIGAGAGGLNAGRRCLSAGHQVTIYEQNADIGGTWIFEPQAGGHSALYERMHTNLPKEVMAFHDFPFPPTEESFLEHPLVLAYLQEYAKPIRHLIHFGTTVQEVKRDETDSTWLVTVSSVSEGSSTTEFDVVFVCSGHYRYPDVPEFATRLQLPYIHSKDYRRPSDFAGKRVAIVGAGPSGIDITLQVAKEASKVYLCHNNVDSTKLDFPAPTQIVAGAKDAQNRSLVLNDGSTLDDLDAVIFCTGYVYKFPFLGPEIVEIRENGSLVSPLFAHLAHARFSNSLFFVGLNIIVIPFILFDYQLSLALALIDHRAKVDAETIAGDEARRIRTLEEANQPLKRFHVLHEAQWDYFRELAEYAGEPYWTPPVVTKMNAAVGETRQNDVVHYKKNIFVVLDDENFKLKDSGLREFY